MQRRDLLRAVASGAAVLLAGAVPLGALGQSAPTASRRALRIELANRLEDETAETPSADTVRTRRRSAQSVRTIDGGAAQLMIGTAVPFTFQQWIRTGGGWTAVEQTVFYESLQGLRLQPRLRGDLVEVDVEPISDSGAVADRRHALRLRGPLGTWLPVAPATSPAPPAWWLRVELVP